VISGWKQILANMPGCFTRKFFVPALIFDTNKMGKKGISTKILDEIIKSIEDDFKLLKFDNSSYNVHTVFIPTSLYWELVNMFRIQGYQEDGESISLFIIDNPYIKINPCVFRGYYQKNRAIIRPSEIQNHDQKNAFLLSID